MKGIKTINKGNTSPSKSKTKKSPFPLSTVTRLLFTETREIKMKEEEEKKAKMERLFKETQIFNYDNLKEPPLPTSIDFKGGKNNKNILLTDWQMYKLIYIDVK